MRRVEGEEDCSGQRGDKDPKDTRGTRNYEMQAGVTTRGDEGPPATKDTPGTCVECVVNGCEGVDE